MHYRQDLIKAFARAARSPRLLNAFLQDILTPQEYDEIITRWQIVRLLARKVPQRTISKKLGVSIAKVTRGSRVMRQLSGGFRTILKNLQ